MSIKYYVSQIEDEIEEAQDIEALKKSVLKLMTFMEMQEVSISDIEECLQLLTEGKLNAANKYFSKYISQDNGGNE